MAYETSYDTGLKPFNHDKNRGKWSSPRDFFFACLGHAFKADVVILVPAAIFHELGIYALIPHFIALCLVVVPLVFIQSFLGQFSSTGFISVFRIAPLFKGIGHLSLAINLLTLTYYSVFSAIPLFYLFHSLRPTIPWSCEGAKEWMVIADNMTTPCEKNENFTDFQGIDIPSIEFFRVYLNTMDLEDETHPEGTFSWWLMLCTFLVWIMVAGVLVQPTETVGRLIRYSCLAVGGILGICLLRFSFLPGALWGIELLFMPYQLFYVHLWLLVPVFALSALGPGWGSILTMASYNNFKTDIFKYSWLLCFAQAGVMLGLAILSILMKSFMQQADPALINIKNLYAQWTEFLIIPSGITNMELPHFWSVLFFVMLILGSLNLVIVQLFSVLTSLFDEYEKLRSWRTEVTLGAVGILALISIFFCSNYGVSVFEMLIKFSTLTQMLLNLLLLLVVLWLYGRERFQRDVNFMTSRPLPSWMINVTRFVTPIFLLFVLIAGAVLSAVRTFNPHSYVMNLTGVVLSYVPCLLIPGYCIFKIMQTSGALVMRLKRCVRPTDWYPADPVYRQHYEDTFSGTEMSHQLTEATIE